MSGFGLLRADGSTSSRGHPPCRQSRQARASAGRKFLAGQARGSTRLRSDHGEGQRLHDLQRQGSGAARNQLPQSGSNKVNLSEMKPINGPRA